METQTSSLLRAITGALLVGLPFLSGGIGCGEAQPPPVVTPSEATVLPVVQAAPVPSASTSLVSTSACGEIPRPEQVASLDLAKLGVDPADDRPVRMLLETSSELVLLANSIDADLRTACAALLADSALAAPASGDTNVTCRNAIKAIGELKAKAGGSFSLSIKPPSCSSSMMELAECAGSCDTKNQQPRAEVRCNGGEISGLCAGRCSGLCSLDAGQCAGTCEGTCQGAFAGSCSGKCDGKCDGRTSHAKCTGKCEGACDGPGDGTCKGTCRGQCKQSDGPCSGRCTGMCSVELRDPKCTGILDTPSMPKACRTRCDLRVVRKSDCSPARVQVRATGVADAKAAERLIALLQTNLPAVLKIAMGLRDGAQTAARDADEVLGNFPTNHPSAARSACVGKLLGGSQQAINTLREDLDLAVRVLAGATSSGSGP